MVIILSSVSISILIYCPRVLLPPAQYYYINLSPAYRSLSTTTAYVRVQSLNPQQRKYVHHSYCLWKLRGLWIKYQIWLVFKARWTLITFSKTCFEYFKKHCMRHNCITTDHNFLDYFFTDIFSPKKLQFCHKFKSFTSFYISYH